MIAGVFHELADAEARIFLHQLEADPALRRQAVGGKFQPRIGDNICRYHDRAAAALQFIGNAARFQSGDHFSLFGVAESGVQHAHDRVA